MAETSCTSKIIPSISQVLADAEGRSREAGNGYTMNSPAAEKSCVIPMTIVAVLFFVLAFSTWLTGSLMRYLELVLSLSPVQASFILFSFYIAVAIFAMPSAWVIRRVG